MYNDLYKGHVKVERQFSQNKVEVLPDIVIQLAGKEVFISDMDA